MAKLPFRRSSEAQEVSITISARTFYKFLALIISTILLLSILSKASHALVLIFTAFFLAVALNAPVTWVARHLPGALKGRRGLATSLATFLVVGSLVVFIASMVPPIAKQSSSLISRAPQLVRDLRDSDSDVGRFIKKYHLSAQVDTLTDQVTARVQRAGSSAVTTFSSFTSRILSLLTVIVLTFMMLVEGPYWIDFGLRLLPKERRKTAKRLSADMYKVVKGYVNGQVLLAFIAAWMLLPGLLIFNVSYPIALMAVVFICGLIPMVGHTIGAILVSLVALITSPLSALGILLYYFLYQQIENYLVQPRLQANATNMSPLLVFASLVIGLSFGGILGGLVAIPVAGCLRVLLLDYLESRDLIPDPPAVARGRTK